MDSISFVYGQSGQAVETQTVLVSIAMQGVQLGLSNSGYYSVYAYGLCQGRTTAMSSGLAVYNQVASSGGSSTQFATLFSVRYTGFTVETFTSADQKEVCTNVRGLQPGGTCKILSLLPGSVVVTGTVSYPIRGSRPNKRVASRSKLHLGCSDQWAVPKYNSYCGGR